MKRISILLLVIITRLAVAQSVEVKWGKNYGKNKKDETYTPVGITTHGNLVIRSESANAAVDKIIGNASNSGLRGWYRLDYVRTANHIYTYVDICDKKTTTTALHLLDIDPNGNSKGDKVIYTWKFNEKPIWGYSPEKLVISADKKTLARLPFTYYAGDKVTVFDEDLKVLWQNQLDIEESRETTTATQFRNRNANIIVTNSGKLVACVAVYKDGESSESELPDSYAVLVTDNSGTKTIKLDLGGKAKPNGFFASELANGEVLIAGTYYNFAPPKYKDDSPNPNNVSVGIFAVKLNTASASLASPVLTPFSAETISKMGDSKKNEVYYFGVSNIFQSTAGKPVLVVQSGVMAAFNNLSGSNYRSGSVSYSKGNIIIGLNDDLKPTYETAAPHSFTADAHYKETDAFVTGNKLLLLYNSKEKQADVSNRFKYQFCDLESGTLSAEQEIPLPQKAYFFTPLTTFQLSDTQIAVGAAPSNANDGVLTGGYTYCGVWAANGKVISR